MNNLEISQKAIKRAERWYQSAIRGFEDEKWDDVIYSYEMAVEQALKAVLILYCIEYPKQHDISNIYLTLKEHDVPKWFLEKIKIHSKFLLDLVKKRSIAAYGYVDGITEKKNLKMMQYILKNL